jgi:4-hydroxy-tetrahydrodipicolinate synthase
MTKSTPFNGVFTALVTPFTTTGSIDWAAFDRLIDTQLEFGIKGLVPVGTTGEAATLEDHEALAVIAHTVKRAGNSAYVLAGTGSNVTKKSVTATSRAADAGAHGALLITPYYNKPTQEGLISHFSAVAEAAPIDIMLYSVPGRTGVAITPDTAGTLARSHANIIGIKEAGGDPARVTQLRAACGPEFSVHCGDDGLALPFFSLGACGLTSVLSNYRPREVVALYDAWANGRLQEALALHERLSPLAAAMFVESSPSPVKRALSLSGAMTDLVRLPLVPLSSAGDAHLRAAMAQAGVF